MWKNVTTAFNQHNSRGLIDLLSRTLALNLSFKRVRKHRMVLLLCQQGNMILYYLPNMDFILQSFNQKKDDTTVCVQLWKELTPAWTTTPTTRKRQKGTNTVVQASLWPPTWDLEWRKEVVGVILLSWEDGLGCVLVVNMVLQLYLSLYIAYTIASMAWPRCGCKCWLLRW